ncbi:MAG: helix-turn-helix domain-containing protein [Opitutus sp.]
MGLPLRSESTLTTGPRDRAVLHDHVSKPRPRLTAQVRKDAIARAALPLFARNGLHGVTTRELASACGVSEALIFRHFPTKEALLIEMLDQYRDLIMPCDEQVESLPPPMVLFVLRGMGVREEALQQYATPETFSVWRKQSR